MSMNEENVGWTVKGICYSIFFFYGIVVLYFGRISFIAFLAAALYVCLAYLIIPFFVFLFVRKGNSRSLQWVSIADPVVILLLYVAGYGTFWIYVFTQRSDPFELFGLLLYYSWGVNFAILGAFIVYALLFSLVKKGMRYRSGQKK